MMAAAMLAKNAVEKGLRSQAVGQDLDGSRLEGRHGLLRQGRHRGPTSRSWASTSSATAARRASATRARSPTRSPGDQRQRPRRRLGPVGQPQLRGPHQPRRQDELPRPPAARHRLRARRHDGLRLRRPSRWAGHRRQADVFLEDIWPAPADVEAHHRQRRSARRCSPRDYADVFAGDERWQSLPTPEGDTFEWDADSTYVRKPPYFDGMTTEPTPVTDIDGRAGAGQAR